MEENENIQNTETATENAGEQEVEKQPDEVVEKTYTQKEVDELLKGKLTQEQVNEIVEKRLARAKVSSNGNEELTKVKGEVASLQLKLAEYEKKVALSKYKIDEQYQDYVNFKVLHMTDKNKDYATALEEFFNDEENKRFLVGEIASKPPVPRPKNANSLENERASDNNLRAMFGLKNK